jgi:transcriptional regulator with XRE-family HTH domain
MSYILYDMISQSLPSELTAKHVRAARALLAWSQQDLSKVAGVATSTVADFERGQRTPIANNAQAIRNALEGAGIHFLPTGAVIGPALPAIVTASDRSVAPVRWVTAEDLSDWANRTDGAFSLPTLIAHLVLATHGTAAQLRFPADEGVRYAGWDGQSFVDVASAYVPQGKACWELSAQRENITSKATDDFRKRTANPGAIDPTFATFIFVTIRHWPQKDEWVKERKNEGSWRDVRVFDSDDLVHWIEQSPAIGLWLATRLGKRPEGTRELEEVWEEWSLATRWPLTEDLVLSDRDQDAVEVLRWLRGEPAVLSLQATTADEVVAFFHATLSELPADVAAAYRARCLVATTPAAARALANVPGPLFLLLTEPEPGLARSLVTRGHYVLLAYDERLIAYGKVRTLARPSREGIARALVASGVEEPHADALARDSARNLAVLRRRLPDAPGHLPKWAEDPPPRALLAALLAGGWDEDSAADKARLSELAEQPYEAIASVLTRYVGQFDSPLQKIGSSWRIASPSDAWSLLARYLTSADVLRFEATAYAVLGSADPRFELDPKERWMASIHGVRRDYSGVLRHGIGQVLILFALWGDRAPTVSAASDCAEAIVSKLLSNADEHRWWSLSRDFRLLAEAAPDAFLAAVEDSLDQSDPPIRVLFGQDEGGLFGSEHLSDLMWALEILGWSPDLLPRVTNLLARLDAIDVKPRRYSNGPASSLREIHLLWIPQTYATLEQRLRALDMIRKCESDAAWKLMLGILPRGHDSSSPSPMPRWRDFSVDKVEDVTWMLVSRGAAAITERLIADVGLSPARWSVILDRLSDLAPEPDSALSALEAAEPKITDKADRAELWGKLRQVLHHNRQFYDAEWSLKDAVLNRLEAVYNRFAPTDPLERIAWLFQSSVAMPLPSPNGWERERSDVDAARRTEARVLYASGGVPAILSLARLSDSPGYIGKALFDSGLPAADIDAIIVGAVRSGQARERDVAYGLIKSAFNDGNKQWGEALVAKAQNENWDDTALLTILRALPEQRWTWERVAQIGGEIETTYWRRMPVFWVSQESQDISYAIRRLIDVGRARHAVALAGRGDKVDLPTALLLEVLQEASRQHFEDDGGHNEAAMFQHYVTEILQILDERIDVDRNALIALEWSYLLLLERSRRPAKVLLQALSEQPQIFIEMLSMAFKAREDSGVVDREAEDQERASKIATQAYRLLGLWDRIPGTRDDGSIDGEVLKDWIQKARVLAKTAGRDAIADDKIGAMLSASPIGADGTWPAEPIREIIDFFRSKPMIAGFVVGKQNRRGVTTRMPRDGGALERNEAALHRRWATAVAFDYPHTSKALNRIADAYDCEAGRHDEDAARLDWEA